jgi:hypothetical protein
VNPIIQVHEIIHVHGEVNALFIDVFEIAKTGGSVGHPGNSKNFDLG